LFNEADYYREYEEYVAANLIAEAAAAG
jgi:hypothetical protein